MFKVAISKDARFDLDELSNFYQRVSVNLKLKFLHNFQHTTERLKINPYHEIRYDKFRMRQVSKFPVIIHYIILEERKIIRILGIRHAKQNSRNYPKI